MRPGRQAVAVAAACALVLGACGGGDGPITEPTLGEPTVIVPSDRLPAEVTPKNSNNNLDIVDHDGRLYLAFRTGLDHFASTDVTLYVVSTTDEKSWRYEGQFAMGTDLREPRFLSWEGRLFLYFAVLGSDPGKFEPQGMMVTEYMGPGEWTAPQSSYEPEFVPWRTAVVNGVPYLMGYIGGGNIYEFDGEPITIHFLTTSDGYQWAPVVPGQPVVLTGGGSETAFVFQDDGSLVAVVRNEAGEPEFGFGSKICRAEAGALGDWSCVADPKKYDSPIMFRHGQEIYLIGRRNVSETGNFDLMLDGLDMREQALQYGGDYWLKPKRCALWQVDPDALRVDFVLDLPSFGDTCFPGVVPRGEHRFLVYNYTSPLDGDDLIWMRGQYGPTVIYRIELELPAPSPSDTPAP